MKVRPMTILEVSEITGERPQRLRTRIRYGLETYRKCNKIT